LLPLQIFAPRSPSLILPLRVKSLCHDRRAKSPGQSLPRPSLERRFLALCKREYLPPPDVNVWLAGFEVDVLWREQRLVVELDGYAFHSARVAFERDRIRDAAIQLAGYRVLRVTHRRLEAEPGAVVEAVRSLL
jgi:hypothetical protein